MPDNNSSAIYDLVTLLRERTNRTYEEVRRRMTEDLKIFEYERSVFYNKFRRPKRKSTYYLDEVLALVGAFYEDLSETTRCTAYEAIELLDLTGMRLDDHQHLKVLFGEIPYQAAWSQYLQEHGLSVLPDKEEPIENIDSDRGYVFISYSDEDATIAHQVGRLIEASGYRVWQDVTAIPGGREWIHEIEQGINGSCALVVITSAHLTSSYWIWEEILHAQRRDKQIIPIVVDDSPLPFGIQQIHGIDAYSDFEVGIKQLLDALEPCLHSGDHTTILSQRQIEVDYLDHLLLEYGAWKTAYTPMAGTALRAAVSGNTSETKTVNVPLQITTDFDLYIEEKLNKLQALDYQDDILRAIDDLRQFVLLGEPGGGKTATLWHIAASYADAAKSDEAKPLPVLVKLDELTDQQTIQDKIESQLGDLARRYGVLLQSGRLALLIDGLNEIPQKTRTTRVNELHSLVKTAVVKSVVLVISCRAMDYTRDLELDIAGRVNIKSLDPLRVRQIIDNYIEEPVEKRDELFWALAGAEGRRFWERFVEEVGYHPDWFWLLNHLPDGVTWGYGEGETLFYYWNQWLRIRQRPERLLELASNPFMLYMLMRIFVRNKQLPANRSKLLDMFVDFLLTHREGLSATMAHELIEKLAELAYLIQQSDNSDNILVETAQQHLGNEAAFYAAQSASILVSDGESAQFAHHLIRDYFAAQALNGKVHTGVLASEYWPPEFWWQRNKWDESAILLAGLHENDTTPIITWLQSASPEVAARCIMESGGLTPDSVAESLIANWTNRLGEMPIVARASIGRALGILGKDPRPGVGLTPDGMPDIDWVEIPGGEFIYGDNEKRKIDTFFISRYPITYLQFQAFIDADDGFDQPIWWGDLAQRAQSPGIQGFPYANHPRERVSWYDAIAFCRWLSNHLGREISLPTEYQWEKAARGAEGSLYPYDNEFDVQRGNVDETEVGKTSAVGLFPEGASPYGVLDMSGNVFEWCLNLAESPDEISLTSVERRSLRGGSWAHSREHARANFRYANHSRLRRNRVGFRIISV